MRLSLLEQREEVPVVMVDTLNRFFLEYFPNREVSASTKPNGGNTFYGNRYLNFFASRDVAPGAFQVIINEYSNTNVWWRSILQLFYVRLAIRNFILKRHHHYKFFLKAPKKSKVSSWLFMGGNSRVRVIDASMNQSMIILKEGYPTKMISNEAKLRSRQDIKILPSIIQIGDRYIAESLVPGIPINRLKSKSKRNKLRVNAYHQIYKEITASNISFESAYLVQLVEDVNTNLTRLELSSFSISYEDLIQSLDGSQVPVGQIHGDLQDANIILTKEGVKVIDLEATRLGSLWYDYITLFGGVRQGKDVDQIEKWIFRPSSWNLWEDQFDAEAKFGFQNDLIFITFLLEEVLYSLDYVFVDKRRIVPQRLREILLRINKWVWTRR